MAGNNTFGLVIGIKLEKAMRQNNQRCIAFATSVEESKYSTPS